MNKKIIENNIVEKYFEQNPNQKLSVKTIKKKLNLKKVSTAYYYCINSENLRLVKPHEIGSNKTKIYVFTYGEEEEKN